MSIRNVNKFLVDFLTHCSGDNFRKWKSIAQQRDVHELHDEYQLALEFPKTYADVQRIKKEQLFDALESGDEALLKYMTDDPDDGDDVIPFS